MTKKLHNSNHHQHHNPDKNGMGVNIAKKSVNHLNLPKSQPIRKKNTADFPSSSRNTFKSLNFSLDTEVNQTSTPNGIEKDQKWIPSPKSKHELISPTIGISYEGPLTSLKISDDVTSDLGRSVRTSAEEVREDVWNRWDGNFNSDSTQDNNQKLDSILSGDAGFPKTPRLFMNDIKRTDEDCFLSDSGSITDDSVKTVVNDNKTNSKVVNGSKGDNMVDSFNSLNISKELKLKKPADLASRSKRGQHRKCCGDHTSNERPPERKCQLLARRKNSLFQIKTKPRKVYVFDKTVEYLHRGHPTRVQRA